MISKTIVKKAITEEIITFIDGPMNDGVVAKVTANEKSSWFYIPGTYVIDNSAEWYTDNVSLETKTKDVYTALKDLKEEDNESYYLYGDMIISELNQKAKKAASDELLTLKIIDILKDLELKTEEGSDFLKGAYAVSARLTGKTVEELRKEVQKWHGQRHE